MVYAIIESGGKQYRVSSGQVLDLEKIAAKAGETVSLDRVFLIQGDRGLTVGEPTIPGASVTAEVLSQGRGRKVIVFKKKRRKNYRRTNGHRQAQTRVRITDIVAGPDAA
jgi:large subunit ribosomal protein L21